ncbi:MAG: hypothetical protein QHJ34_02240 [bacterium]|jgi:hypothetical protein|nr:hypothetical protein [candidate division KSB1 bacterium]MDH7559038.1 hypothetical protein [bacterium]
MMQKDFHYYAVMVLAHLAGFSPAEARVIAYSSQFVDDSSDSGQVKVGDYYFDTVRTAHLGLQFFTWNVHKKIYFPFHFVPSLRWDGQYSPYATTADCTLSRLPVERALAERGELRLYQLGVALHAYADTWAHEGFSGRRHLENDVRALRRFVDGEWRRCRRAWDVVLDLFRARVGHLQAYAYPDLPYERWRYVDFRGRTFERDNPARFCHAARAVFDWLCAARGTRRVSGKWASLEKQLRALFALVPAGGRHTLAERCAAWVETFPEAFADNALGPHYDPHQWRYEALRIAGSGDLQSFLRTDLVRFQRAALRQRFLVLERMM